MDAIVEVVRVPNPGCQLAGDFLPAGMSLLEIGSREFNIRCVDSANYCACR